MKKVLFSLFIITSVLLATSCGNSDSKDKAEKSETTEDIEIGTSTETIEINGVNHFFERMGKGKPLVVLHGESGFHNYLVPHFKSLAKDYEVIFYDQRGCGKTDFPKDTSSINLNTFIDDLEAIRKHLKLEKLNLVGHSWGSLLALSYGKKYPQNINTLILISPAPSNPEFFDITFSNVQQKRSEEDTKQLVQTMMSAEFEKREEKAFKKVIQLGDKPNLVDQDRIAELYEPMKFDAVSANNLMLVNSLLERTYFDLELTDGINVITSPTLIISGDLDNVPFASTQSIHDNIKESKLEVIKKSCHYPFFESPKEFNAIVKNFLDPEYDQ